MMQKRFVSLWFHQLLADSFVLRKPALQFIPFVISQPSAGRMVIVATNRHASAQGIVPGMVVADARALIPSLEVLEHPGHLAEKLLHRIADWCIRFTPSVAIDGTDGLMLDATGCTNLWEGDYGYISAIEKRLADRGYQVRASVADTIGAAWGLARYGKGSLIAEPGNVKEVLLPLPPPALRLEQETIDRLNKLGLTRISDFINMPQASLRRRFGQHMIDRLTQALGISLEAIVPIVPEEPYQERLPCLEPISTANGIGIALKRLLDILCIKLEKDQKGLRKAILKCFKLDGTVQQIEIGTSKASRHVGHLFKLFENLIQTIRPDLGIELFILEAPRVEDHEAEQESIWETGSGLDDQRLAELVDRLTGRLGDGQIHRYLPAEHHWPERAITATTSLTEKPSTTWRTERARPLQLLDHPEKIDVTAPIPDYPPMLFRRNKKLYRITRADGPERIEQEWWLQQGEHRDYYSVEDEEGNRYWIFRSGHYAGDNSPDWYIHGFFA